MGESGNSLTIWRNMLSRSSIFFTVALLTLGAGRQKKAPAPAVPVPAPPAKTDPAAEPPADPWEFDALPAPIFAHGEIRDELARTLVQQLGLKLDGDARLTTSAHSNSVGGVTLHIADPGDAKAACDLYASKDGEQLKFEDSRCTFPAFRGELRTTATCRKISGTARRLKDSIALEASSPDCTTTLQGVPLQISGSVKAR
jgi:hypothetical protein